MKKMSGFLGAVAVLLIGVAVTPAFADGHSFRQTTQESAAVAQVGEQIPFASLSCDPAAQAAQVGPT